MAIQSVPLNEWFERLRKVELPVFGEVAVEVSRLTEKKGASNSELTSVILQDPSMTARVLKIANSAFYSSHSRVTTVSRAITLLGFDVVGRICLSVALLDSLLKRKPKKMLLRELARSFYAAALARTMAEKRRDESPEEVFIAALLYRIGAMAFWCSADDEASKLEGLPEGEASEREVLGFSLGELSLRLAQEWHLGELLTASLLGADNPRVHAILLAHSYSRAISAPQQTLERKELIKTMARYASSPVETMEELIRQNAELAVDFARKIGAEAAIAEIPGQKGMTKLDPSVSEPVQALGEVDAQLQLRILRELAMSASSELEQAALLVVEGLYRGVGLDRVVFLRITDTGDALQGQLALSVDSSEITSSFKVPLTGNNIFAESCRDDQSIWAPILPEAESALLSPSVQEIVRQGPFLFSPIRNSSRLVGAIYADRQPTRRPLDRECSESFELFCFQLRSLLGKGG
jgi:HD-like signal output (HDOD) protein